MAAKVPTGWISKKQVLNQIGPHFWMQDAMIDSTDVDRWIAAGHFPAPAGRMGDQYYWYRDDVARWLKHPPAECKARFRSSNIAVRCIVDTGGAE